MVAAGKARRGIGRAAALAAFASFASPASAHDEHAAHDGHAPAVSPAAAPAARFEPPAPGSYALPVIERIEPHGLLGSSGLPEKLIALEPGQLALVSFVYLQCGEACPLSTAMLHDLDRALAKDAALAQRVELVTVSFDPERDRPEQMEALRERMASQGRWRFLTAKDAAALRPVLADFGQDAVWIPGGENTPDALRHVLKVFLVDASGAVRQIYSTGFLDLRLVLADLRTLLPTAP